MTHEHIKALDKLIAAVEADSDIGFRFWFEADDAIPDLDTRMLCETAFHGSLDAAKALHEALLPGWGWTVSADGSSVYGDDPKVYDGDDARSPARAWLIAILKAYRAKMVA